MSRKIRWARNVNGFDDNCTENLVRKRDRKRLLGGFNGYIVESIKMHRENSRLKGEDFVNFFVTSGTYMSHLQRVFSSPLG